MTEKATDLANEKPSEAALKDFGRFGYSPIPSEQNVSLNSSPDGSTTSPEDVFGLVLLLGAVQPIWQLRSLFCYRGLWQDECEKGSTVDPLATRQDVVLTVATGIRTIIPYLI